MKNITIISANPKDIEQSVSLQLAKYAYETLAKKYPEANISEINLYDNPIQDMNKNIFMGNIGEVEGQILAQRTQMLETFLNSDLVVLSTPMWNHNYPAQVKLFLDCVWSVKNTFAYNENGDIYGLLKPHSKKVVLIASMGGLNFYKGNDYGYMYAKDTFQTIGLAHSDIKYVPVQGSAFVPQDGHSQAIGFEKAVAQGKELLDFTLSSIK